MIDKIDMIIAIVLSCLVFIFYTNSTMPQRKNLQEDLLLSYNSVMIFPARQKEGIIHAA